MSCECVNFKRLGCCYHFNYDQFKRINRPYDINNDVLEEKMREPLPSIPSARSTNNETAAVLSEVADERSRQLQKWGIQLHSEHTWCPILVEEVGEVAKALNEKRPDEYRAELIQVAAVAVAAVEALDKRSR